MAAGVDQSNGKRKAESGSADGSAAKSARAASDEQDAAPDSRPRLSVPVRIDPHHATLNVIPTHGGRLLMALTHDGMQYLVAAARANVAVKSGRYLFEAKIVEILSQPESHGAQASTHSVRVGFSEPGFVIPR